MSERKKQLWSAYFWSLGIAGAISLTFLPTLRSSGWLNAITMSLIATFAFGTGFFLLGAIREIVRFPTFLLNLGAQTLLLALTLIIPTLLVSWVAIATLNKTSLLNPDVLHAVRHNINPNLVISTLNLTVGDALIIGALISLVINTSFQFSRKIGPGMFANWVTGRYYNPREEERIFMFLDMKDSTTLAEQLGNLKFSALVRDFFRDLTYPVLETKGEVSHFIGDEVVLTWKLEQGLSKWNCVQAFFKMKTTIKDRSEHYMSQYGLVPEFKAGLHVGKVVATEVGEIKSEIVFHGDVLNTAARIQALCNGEGYGLLMSGDLAARLPSQSGWAVMPLGARVLKGKAHDVEIATVETA